jgi:phosphate ABC transporter phosphate-binding protein
VTRWFARVLTLLIALSIAGVGAPAYAAYVPVSGAGSTWSSNAIDQWRANVRASGLTVNYSATGSSDGRVQFRNGTVDFGVSEIPYDLTDNGEFDPHPARKFAYMPIVAGGTSFMYNLKVGTKRVTNLRLSQDVLVKIFTGVITNWSDRAIANDNPGLNLPSRKIIPVVRSDGSGTTAQFTKWMSVKHAALWNAYCQKAGRKLPCGMTSFYPQVSSSPFISQAGSNSVSGYVAQEQSEGAITYVEFSYARALNFPVVKLRNAGDYYVLPTAQNVAVALTKASINNDPRSTAYLTQQLEGVYNNTDPRAYPLSSYSYMIVPTAVEGNFNTAKGFSLGAFAYFFLCEGQQRMDDLGYSPLPINLVKAGFEQVKKIPGVNAKTVDIKGCHNPTFSPDGSNTLAKTAPQPSQCDKYGVTNCSSGGSGGTGGTGGNNGTGAGGTGATGTAGTGTQIDPDTGLPVGGEGSLAGGADQVPGVAVGLPVRGWSLSQILMVIAGGLLVILLLGPPLMARMFQRRGDLP